MSFELKSAVALAKVSVTGMLLLGVPASPGHCVRAIVRLSLLGMLALLGHSLGTIVWLSLPGAPAALLGLLVGSITRCCCVVWGLPLLANCGSPDTVQCIKMSPKEGPSFECDFITNHWWLVKRRSPLSTRHCAQRTPCQSKSDFQWQLASQSTWELLLSQRLELSVDDMQM